MNRHATDGGSPSFGVSVRIGEAIDLTWWAVATEPGRLSAFDPAQADQEPFLLGADSLEGEYQVAEIGPRVPGSGPGDDRGRDSDEDG